MAWKPIGQYSNVPLKPLPIPFLPHILGHIPYYLKSKRPPIPPPPKKERVISFRWMK